MEMLKKLRKELCGIQDKILELLLSHIHWSGKGKVLDIGCGSGSLSVKIATKYADAAVTGVDYWGGMWEYSQKKCEVAFYSHGFKAAFHGWNHRHYLWSEIMRI